MVKVLKFFLYFLLLLIISCADQGQNSSSSNTNSELSLAAINYFKKKPSIEIKGYDGYMIILKEYLQPNCGSCHGSNGITFPYFASTNLDEAYRMANLYLNKDSLLSSIVKNRFCGPGCNLDTRGEVYQAISYWLDHR